MFFLTGFAAGFLLSHYHDKLPAVWAFLKKEFAYFKDQKDVTAPPPAASPPAANGDKQPPA